MSRLARFAAAGIAVSCAALALLTQGAAWQTPPEVPYPPEDAAAINAARKLRQARTVSQFQVFHEFQFADKVKESGITYVSHIVDDAGKDYRPAHYDHGTGLAVADVDGDGLYDIYFVSETGGNELWKNLGGGKFRNITKEAGVAVPGRISVSAAFADIDNDGDPDLFVTTVRGGNLLFENDGHGHFRDITAEAGVGAVAHSSGPMFLDYDRDGLLDLFVCNVGVYTSDKKGPQGEYWALPDAFDGHMFPERFEFPTLYRNLGHNKFKDVSAEVGLRPVGWAGDAAFADLDGTGYPSIYVLNMMGTNHFFENRQGKFTEQTAKYFPKTPWGAMGIKFFDYDNDGRMDLIVTDMHTDMWWNAKAEEEKNKAPRHEPESFLMGPADSFVYGNALYHNLGGGKFEEVSDAMGVENYWPWGVSAGDINADGWEDLFISSGMAFPFRYGINSMLLNNRGAKFLDAEFLLGIEPRRGGRTHAPLYQIDCSAPAPDPGAAALQPCKGRKGVITVLSALATRSSAIFDLDNDGDLDIVTNEFDTEPQILVSGLSERRAIHWLKVKLAGTVSNRDGLGATVRVTAGGKTQTRYHDGKSGYLSQSSLPLYFGLGDARTVDRVEVDWPSGRKSSIASGIAINGVMNVTESK